MTRRTKGPPLWLVLGAPALLLGAALFDLCGDCRLDEDSRGRTAAPIRDPGAGLAAPSSASR